jgi:hypothetical protein
MSEALRFAEIERLDMEVPDSCCCGRVLTLGARGVCGGGDSSDGCSRGDNNLLDTATSGGSSRHFDRLLGMTAPLLYTTSCSRNTK